MPVWVLLDEQPLLQKSEEKSYKIKIIVQRAWATRLRSVTSLNGELLPFNRCAIKLYVPGRRSSVCIFLAPLQHAPATRRVAFHEDFFFWTLFGCRRQQAVLFSRRFWIATGSYSVRKSPKPLVHQVPAVVLSWKPQNTPADSSWICARFRMFHLANARFEVRTSDFLLSFLSCVPDILLSIFLLESFLLCYGSSFIVLVLIWFGAMAASHTVPPNCPILRWKIFFFSGSLVHRVFARLCNVAARTFLSRTAF